MINKEKRLSKVAMIVWNEFLNDARVLKEAQSLQSAGHQVVVHALHTPGVTLEKETLPSGIQVIRVARTPFWKLHKRRLAPAKSKAVHKLVLSIKDLLLAIFF